MRNLSTEILGAQTAAPPTRRRDRVIFYAALTVALVALAVLGHTCGLVPLSAGPELLAAPLIVGPATLAIWRQLVDEFEQASSRAGGYDAMRAAAAGLLGSVRAAIQEHDAEQAKRNADGEQRGAR